MRFLVVGVLLASAALVSCTDDQDAAQETADRLAEALTAGSLPADLFGGTSPQEEYDAIVAGLGEAGPTVGAGEVTPEDGTAEAALAWEWSLDGHEWSYESTARLTEGPEGWTATWEPALVEPSLEGGETLTLDTLPSERGDVLGAGAAALVTSRPVVRYGIDKTQVSTGEARVSAGKVARLLELDARPYIDEVTAAGPKAFVEAVVLRVEDAREVDPAYARIPGAVALDGEMPLPPTREFAAPLLGRVGEATAEIVEKSEGRVEPGDVVGLSGLQARYDEQLAGTPGLRVGAGSEDDSRALFTVEPVDGEPLRTTLDRDLQIAAERALGEDADGPVSAVVALRPSTGAVLAAANGPANDGLNAATFGQYAPGSTFKVVTTLALIRSGLTPDSPVECPASIVVDGKRFENYDDYPPAMLGRITLRQAVAHSCNTAFIGLRERLEPGALASAAESLGLGADHDVGFPAYFGQVPQPESETGAAAALIGQGKVLASPMVMAAVAASVQDGRTVVPQLLADEPVEATPVEPLTDAEVAALRELMRAVVTEGSGAFLSDLGEVRAKTGTAEYGDPRPDGSLATHAWMIGARGDLAVAVFVETGESGSSTAGPILERLLSSRG